MYQSGLGWFTIQVVRFIGRLPLKLTPIGRGFKHVFLVLERLGKIEQAKGAIQEAEVRDEANPDVWMQVCMRNAFVFKVLGKITLAGF